MNTRKHVFATAAMALIAALAAGSAFAIASSGDHSANAQRDSTDQATYPSTYPSNRAMDSTDQNETTDSATVEGSSITLGPSTATVTNDRTVVAEPAIVTPTEPAIVAAPDEPMYTPETGDAQYGSKLEPERSMPPAAVEPPSRFNDATGQ